MLPRTVTGLDTGIQALAAGGGHTCALDTGGEVSCWGENFYGQLGDGTTEFKRLTPVAVSGLSGGVSAISAGSVHTCALLSGTVKCWGMNGGGQVGDGSTENRYAPVDVAVGADVQAIATGDSHTCALLTNGQIKCWGAYKTNTPASASLGGHLATAVAAGGGHTCALTTGGGVKCWGANYFGQLGDGTQTDRTEPVDVVGLSSGVQAIAAHGGRSCAILAAGKLLCWGNNYQGILGDGTMADRLTPAPVLGLAGPVQAVTLGFWHACALVQAPDAAQPIVQCWGSNSYGQLGVNPGWLPVDVIIPDVLGYLPYAGTARHCGRRNILEHLTTAFGCTPPSKRRIGCPPHMRPNCRRCCRRGSPVLGHELFRRTGDGTATNHTTPIVVHGLGRGVLAVAAGDSHTCALAVAGKVKCWG